MAGQGLGVLLTRVFIETGNRNFWVRTPEGDTVATVETQLKFTKSNLSEVDGTNKRQMEDSDLTVDSSEIQGQGIPDETKVDDIVKQDQKTQNEPTTAVVSAMTTAGSTELEATVVTIVAEEVAETDVDDMKQDQEAVVEAVATTEESESATTSDIVTEGVQVFDNENEFF